MKHFIETAFFKQICPKTDSLKTEKKLNLWLHFGWIPDTIQNKKLTNKFVSSIAYY